MELPVASASGQCVLAASPDAWYSAGVPCSKELGTVQLVLTHTQTAHENERRAGESAEEVAKASTKAVLRKRFEMKFYLSF